MSIPKFSQGLLLAAALMPVAVCAQDKAVLDDYEAGTNQNKFMAYSFFYDDSKDKGSTVINSATKDGVDATGANVWKVDALKSFGEGANASTKSIKLDFTFGATKPTCGTACSYGQMAGFGTQLVAGTDAGEVIDLTTATNITFWAKASAPMMMRVEIATKPVTNFGYHLYLAALTTTWTKFTVPLVEGPDFAQPTWAATADPQVFNKAQVQKIQFAVSADDNAALLAGVVNIDDIEVNGYKWVPPEACPTCVGTVAGVGGMLSDMETAPFNKNAAGYYWYAYNDGDGRTPLPTLQSEFSEIFEGVTPDLTAITRPIFKVTPAKGAGAPATNGAYIGFTLGPTYLQGAEVIRPFVGIGTKLSDALGVTFTNMATSTGISFSYMTTATSTFEYIRVEAKANQVFGTNAGIIHSVLLPTTAGEWKEAIIPWTKFKLPNWTEVAAIPVADQALKLSAMDKIQWAVQGAPGVKGGFSVDNVRIQNHAFTGIHNTLGARANNFSVAQGLNGIQVSLRLSEQNNAATLRLLDLKGQVVATSEVRGSGIQMAQLGRANMPAGVYSVQAVVGGKVSSAAVTILP